ncbi:hypothetical protein TNCV_132031 [Trichonephila clavipes]|nr:hypothetical protein TNCV_132031 [Trichonephila clavipes]
MTGTLPPLLDSVVGGGAPERRLLRVHMDPMLLCPGKGVVLSNLHIDQISANTRFLLLSLSNNEMSSKSPFAIQKTLVKDSFCRDFLSLDGCTCQLFFESAKRDIGKIEINSIQINVKLK